MSGGKGGGGGESVEQRHNESALRASEDKCHKYILISNSENLTSR